MIDNWRYAVCVPVRVYLSQRKAVNRDPEVDDIQLHIIRVIINKLLATSTAV